jgi:hypothetical protein
VAKKIEYTCDKCKKLIEPYMNMIAGTYNGDTVGQDRPVHTLKFVRPPNNLRGSDTPDLCKKCLKEEIMDYLKNY